MTKIDEFLRNEQKRMDAKWQFAKQLVFLLSTVYLSAFFAIGAWCGLSLFSALSNQGRFVFSAILFLGMAIILSVLKLFPRNRKLSIFIAGFGIIAIGWALFNNFQIFQGI